jgi:hypothetical protein
MRSLFIEGREVMSERLGYYVALAVLCALAGIFGASGLLDMAQASHPDNNAVLTALFAVPGFRAVMLAALAALFFILPSTLRRLKPNFRMTPGRIVITILMLGAVGLATEVGFLALIAPGVVLGVLISQALFNALLAERSPSDTNVFSRIVGAFAYSLRVTRGSFIPTLGVTLLSLIIVLLPFFCAFVVALVLIGWDARSLILTAPLLFLTFVYCECVRYALIARWYVRLERSSGDMEG